MRLYLIRSLIARRLVFWTRTINYLITEIPLCLKVYAPIIPSLLRSALVSKAIVKSLLRMLKRLFPQWTRQFLVTVERFNPRISEVLSFLLVFRFLFLYVSWYISPSRLYENPVQYTIYYSIYPVISSFNTHEWMNLLYFGHVYLHISHVLFLVLIAIFSILRPGNKTIYEPRTIFAEKSWVLFK